MPDAGAYPALGIQGPNANPLEVIGGAAKTIEGITSMQTARQQYAARQKAGQILATSPDLDTAIDQMYKDPTVGPFAGEIINLVRQGQLAQTQIQGEQQTQAMNGIAAVMKALPGAVADPKLLPGLVNSQLAGLSKVARDRAEPAVKAVLSSLLDGLPNDPKEATAMYRQRLAGLATSASVGSDVFGTAAGRPQQIDVGGKIVPGMVSPTTGAFTPAGDVLGKTLPPQILQGPYGEEGAQTATPVGGAYGTGEGRGGAPTTANTRSGQAPSGGGPRPMASGPGMTTQTYLTNRGTTMAKYQEALDNVVQNGSNIMTTVDEARNALQDFKPGAGSSVYARLASVAQAFGAAPELVDKIGNGDLAASQEFNKLMVNTTMGQIRTQLEGIGGSRLSQQEFDTFQKNNPNIDTDPRAIDKIFNFWTRIYNRDATEQSQLNEYLEKGGKLSQWPAEWQKRARQLGFFKPEIKSTVRGEGAPTPEGAPRQAKPPLGSFVR